MGSSYEDRNKIEKALEMAKLSGFQGEHHKSWCIDLMVQALCGDKETYLNWVSDYKNGEDGPDTYDWDSGIHP